MTELFTAIGTLGIVLIGIALILQLISVEDALSFIGRAVAAVVLLILALCILKHLWVGVMVPWLFSALGFLTTLMEWFVIVILGVIVLFSVGRIVLRRIGRHLPLRRDPLRGDGYEIHDAREEKD
jgi:hypothetical protein